MDDTLYKEFLFEDEKSMVFWLYDIEYDNNQMLEGAMC